MTSNPSDASIIIIVISTRSRFRFQYPALVGSTHIIVHCLYKCVGSTPIHACTPDLHNKPGINMMWAVDQNLEYHLEWLILRVRWNAYYLYTR